MNFEPVENADEKGLKKAAGTTNAEKWADAYSKARSQIVACFSAYNSTYSKNVNLSMVVPKAMVTASFEAWYTGAYYQSSFYYFAQMEVKTDGIQSVFLYMNNYQQTLTFNLYYD